MKKSKNSLKTIIVFILLYSLPLLAAIVLFNTNIDLHKQKTKDEITMVKTKIENIIESRMISSKGIGPYIELYPDFTQGAFDLFAGTIYDSNDKLIKNLTFITDSTITHIYPYEENKQVIGIDLAEVEDQSEWILTGMQENKNVLAGPLNLVQGGLGIVVRMPIRIQGEYYGQLGIVFDYDKIIELAGLNKLSKDNFVNLSTYNRSKDAVITIWTNADGQISDQISKSINFQDIALRMEIAPKDGWQGYSGMFILTIILGFFVSLVASYLFYKILESRDNLELTNLKLKANEDELSIKYKEVLEEKKRTQYIAIHDPLTGFYNRRKCIEDLENRIEEGKDFTIFLFDIDDFKKINDTRGHTYGDGLLREFADLIRSVTSELAENYRIGGDEFLVFIPDLQDPEEISGRMNFVYNELEKNTAGGKIDNKLTISLGVARYPLDGDNVEDLIMKADLAMYEAKKRGKNQFCFFEPAILEDLMELVEIENKIRHALKNDGFVLLYQPIINKNTGGIGSFEALIRIKESNLSPGLFIPIAEETGLILEIGEWVIDEAIRQLVEWRKKGYLLKPVAINISPSQVYNGGLEDYLLNSLKSNDIPPSLIILEITENLLLRNTEESIESLNNLRRIGCKVSLDDFGTGYSSLSYLTYIPVDIVKLDKSLKDKFLLTGNVDVIKVLIELCHTLGIEVVIEGVETKAELEKLLMTKSDYFQGYYFAKPLPPEDAIKLVEIKYQDF